MSIRSRLLLYFGLMVGFGVSAFVVLWLYGLPLIGVEGIYANEYRRSIVAVEALADKEQDRFERWLVDRRRELHLMSINTHFSADVASTPTKNGVNPRLRASLSQQLIALKEANPGAYHYLYILDPLSGQVLASSEDRPPAVKAHRSLLEEAQQPGMSESVGIIRDEHGPAALSINQIVGQDADGQPDGRMPGLLVASIALGASLESDDVVVRQTLGDTGQVLLVDRAGDILFSSIGDQKKDVSRYVAQQVVSGTEGVKLLTAENGVRLISVYRHLHLGAADGLSLAVSRGTDEALAANQANFYRMAGLAGLVFLLSMGLVLFASNRIAATEAQIVALNTSLEGRVAARTNELALANSDLRETLFNLERTQDTLVRSEKLAALGSMVAGVAHELNTPIGNALLVASALKTEGHSFRMAAGGQMTRSALEQHVATVASGSDMLVVNLERAAALVSSFKQLAADQTSEQRRSFGLSKVIEEVMQAMHPKLRQTAFLVEVEVPEHLRMDSFPGPLTQIIVNFINNALLHGFEGRTTGTMQLRARSINADTIEIIFTDDGKGMSAEVLRHVFDPFFTTKLGQGGSGLGMHIAYSIATKVLGGSIEVQSTPEQGTRWVLQLPCHAPEGNGSAA